MYIQSNSYHSHLTLQVHAFQYCMGIEKSTVGMYMTCMLQVDLSEHQQSKWGPDISNTTIAAGHVEVFRLYMYTSHCTLQAHALKCVLTHAHTM